MHSHGRGGTRTPTDEHHQAPPDASSTEFLQSCGSSELRQGQAGTDDCSNVVSAPRLPERNEIADQLEAARLVWLRTGDEKTLRRALLDLLRLLEQAE